MRIIDFDAIQNLNISIEQCIDWVEQVFRNKFHAVLPPKNSVKFNNGCFFNTMPSLFPDINRFGVKVVSRYSPPSRMTFSCTKINSPSIVGNILLYDSSNNELLAIMDGTWITAMRTGATAAVTCGLLKKTQTKSYSFIGLGNMARSVLLFLNTVMKNEPLEIKLLKYKDQHNSFIERFSQFKNMTFQVYDSVPMLIRDSDVIISCVTVTKTDFTEDADYPEGVLVIPVHTMGFQNCDLFFDKIYCDDIGHIKNFKYFNQFKNCDEISNIMLGKNKGRGSEKERIIVYNIGVSLHDVFFASKIYDLYGDTLKKDVLLQPSNMKRYWV
ncbi:MAG: hypothetical protein LBE74_01115 [Treponema sp.]|jgi:ornithine cyclodeaminase/alanine dehydrogenase-like protein (mu-crystallin family)|nr:hypothetical protein [Treponema sp.]